MSYIKRLYRAIARNVPLQYKVDSLDGIGIDEFKQMSDLAAVELFGAVFADELSHLKNASVTVESTAGVPFGHLGKNKDQTPSRVLYNKDFPEVNRTLVSMLAIKWVLNNEHTAFILTQKGNKLSEKSFGQLRDFYRRLVCTKEDLHTLLVAMAIDDIGKDPELSEQLKKSGVDATYEDHSDLVYKAAQADLAKKPRKAELAYNIAKENLIPSLQIVPPESQAVILGCLHIGSKLNISQVVQGECPPASLQILSTEHAQGKSINLRAMLTFLDVAGAAGHADSRSCIVMTEPVFQAYMSALEAFKEFSEGTIASPRACYDHIIETRAKNLQQLGLELPSANEGRALSRLLCMGRVTTLEQANQFKRALEELPASTKDNLVNGLNVDGIDDGVAILPYYAPGLLADATKNTDNTDGMVVPILSAFFRFLARVFDGSKPTPGPVGGIVERDLSFAQETIKSREFLDHPEILDGVALPWK